MAHDVPQSLSHVVAVVLKRADHLSIHNYIISLINIIVNIVWMGLNKRHTARVSDVFSNYIYIYIYIYIYTINYLFIINY